ncbi:uncharacterized protein LOC122824458 isoform X2 [Gambusia affinis]|uniref:uncharacterized protein LOC122824458 isoform X2 n=1 Tax=Gambusia affinis TaxID=33528 RepID=UPI001CDC13C5|nr:uncharacterized protein LOC122824458 isoform X2 [Gambusia affinis]
MIVVWTCLRLSEPVLVFQLRFASVHLGLIFLQGRASGSAPQIAGGRRGKRLTLFVCLGWIRQTACREKQAAELCCGQMGQRPSRPGVKHGGGSIMLRQDLENVDRIWTTWTGSGKGGQDLEKVDRIWKTWTGSGQRGQDLENVDRIWKTWTGSGKRGQDLDNVDRIWKTWTGSGKRGQDLDIVDRIWTSWTGVYKIF